MERLQAFRYELRPNGEQQRNLRRFAGACRYVFNQGLALQKANHEAGGKFIGYVPMAKHQTAWRNSAETPWLADAPVHPLQQALRDLERAYVNFFAKRAAFPRFKRRGQRESFRYPDPKQIKLDADNGRIFLPKLGWLRYRNSRAVLGTVRSVTVSLSAGRWFVSILARREVEAPVATATSAIGIDVGVARFATFSDGQHLDALNSFKRHEVRLRRYQRAMARKVKFSRNWVKAKNKVQRLHTRIANVRNDYLHKATTAISQRHALVCIEDLQVRNMARSAAGTVEQPGTNVAQKRGLNRAILDQGWGEFRRQLEYKLAWAGGVLVAVPPHHTSQTCPACQQVAAENRTSQARFECVSCGYTNHADVVGAINVLERGLRSSACGGIGARDRPAKQEPTEALKRVAA